MSFTRTRRQQACTCVRAYACIQPPTSSTQTYTITRFRSRGSTDLQHPWGFAVASLVSAVTANVNPAALPRLCLRLTLRSVSASTGKGNGSASLRNVHNGLLCYCRSTQRLPFLTARIWHYLTARCWTWKKRLLGGASLRWVEIRIWINQYFYINNGLHDYLCMG